VGKYSERTGTALTAPSMVSTLKGGADMTQGTCSVEGCERPVQNRGWCIRHYYRAQRYGDPLGLPQPRVAARCSVESCDRTIAWNGLCHTHRYRAKHGLPLDVPIGAARPAVAPHLRVLRKVEKQGDCWIFTGYLNQYGYAQVRVQSGRKGPYVHRVVYEALVGPIAEGMSLDHLCHTRAAARGECAGGVTCVHRHCVNPDHLEQVPIQENIRRSVPYRNTRRKLAVA
jgi:hypothetical protein